MTKLPNHDFWRYSLKIYSNPKVKDICLTLQARFQINVNLLLYCCWHATSKRGQINKQQMARIIVTLKPWHLGITEGLRNLRFSLSNLPKLEWAQKLRKEILEHELASEHIEQLMIVHTIISETSKHKAQSQKIKDCICNFHTYLTTTNIQLDTEGYALLQQLLMEIFPYSSATDFTQFVIPF